MSVKRGKRISEAEFRRLWNNENLTQTAIGEMLGISDDAVYQRAKCRKFPKRSWKRKSKVGDHGLFREMWAAQVMTIEIANHFGVCGGYVARLAAKLGLSRRGRGWRSSHTAIDFFQDRMAKQMVESAARAQRAIIDNDMADFGRDGRPMGWRKAAEARA